MSCVISLPGRPTKLWNDTLMESALDSGQCLDNDHLNPPVHKMMKTSSHSRHCLHVPDAFHNRNIWIMTSMKPLETFSMNKEEQDKGRSNEEMGLGLRPMRCSQSKVLSNVRVTGVQVRQMRAVTPVKTCTERMQRPRKPRRSRTTRFVSITLGHSP